jgi:DNA polymerase I-like protein with 3'-5' exonuclease and polymerase domains
MSRQDSIGLFWQDIPQKGNKTLNRIMPDIPATGWKAPRDFPRLDSAPYISLDFETWDPELLTHGPGWARRKGHIVGMSISVPGGKWYFPVRHEVRPEENLNPDHVFAWARYTFQQHGKKPVLGANLLYDVGWAGEEGITIAGPCYDVQFAEALLSETADVNLDTLGEKYLGKGKETSLLYQWLADYYGGQPTAKQRINMHRSPPSLAGPYAEEDAEMPARILPLQWQQLAREGLVNLFELETRLIPILIRMRRDGVTVDTNRAQQVSEELKKNVAELNNRLRDLVGFEVNVDANDSLQKAFQKLGLPIPLNPETHRPSFTKDTLPLVEHPVSELILTIRKRNKVRRDFVESAILEKQVNGKLHCQFHPLRGNDGGTRSGRFAGSHPNLQQVPSRDEELAPLVRGVFVPDIGHKRWRRYDYEQIEYRFLAHYAVGPGSDALRAEYNAHPETDYHVNTQNLVQNFTGQKIPRKPIKNFNFGMTFGMGKGKMIADVRREVMLLGAEFKLDGEALYNAYHEALPFTKTTMEFYQKQVSMLGYVTTILGRRSRFDLWEPDTRENTRHLPALPYDQALRVYGKIKRAYGHKALNRVLQGSAADLMKKALLDLWDSGVLDYVGVPRLTVHDELDFSDPLEDTNHEAWRYVKHTFENAIKLRIPVFADEQTGPSWGAAS